MNMNKDGRINTIIQIMKLTNITRKQQEWYTLQYELYSLLSKKELIEAYISWFQEEPESKKKSTLLNKLIEDEYEWKKVYPYHQLKALVEKIKKELLTKTTTK